MQNLKRRLANSELRRAVVYCVRRRPPKKLTKTEIKMLSEEF